MGSLGPLVFERPVHGDFPGASHTLSHRGLQDVPYVPTTAIMVHLIVEWVATSIKLMFVGQSCLIPECIITTNEFLIIKGGGLKFFC